MADDFRFDKYPKDAFKNEALRQVQNPEIQIREQLIDRGLDQFFPFEQKQVPRRVGTSALGTPVLDNVKFQAGSYQIGEDVIEYDDLIIDAVTLEVGQDKNILRTSVQGRNGTVKRYVSDGDYVIVMRGKLVNMDNHLLSPDDQFSNLVKIVQSNEPISVVSKILQALSVFEVVIRNYRFPSATRQNEQAFEIQAFSDEPFEFIISDDV